MVVERLARPCIRLRRPRSNFQHGRFSPKCECALPFRRYADISRPIQDIPAFEAITETGGNDARPTEQSIIDSTVSGSDQPRFNGHLRSDEDGTFPTQRFDQSASDTNFDRTFGSNQKAPKPSNKRIWAAGHDAEGIVHGAPVATKGQRWVTGQDVEGAIRKTPEPAFSTKVAYRQARARERGYRVDDYGRPILDKQGNLIFSPYWNADFKTKLAGIRQVLDSEMFQPVLSNVQPPTKAYGQAQRALDGFIFSPMSRRPATLRLEPEVAASFTEFVSTYFKHRFEESSERLKNISALLYDSAKHREKQRPGSGERLLQLSEDLAMHAREELTLANLYFSSWQAARPAVIHDEYLHREIVEQVRYGGVWEELQLGAYRPLLNLLEWEVIRRPNSLAAQGSRKFLKKNRGIHQYPPFLRALRKQMAQVSEWGRAVIKAKSQANYDRYYYKYLRAMDPIRQMVLRHFVIRSELQHWWKNRYSPTNQTLKLQLPGIARGQLDPMRYVVKQWAEETKQSLIALNLEKDIYARTLSQRLLHEKKSKPKWQRHQNQSQRVHLKTPLEYAIVKHWLKDRSMNLNHQMRGHVDAVLELLQDEKAPINYRGVEDLFEDIDELQEATDSEPMDDKAGRSQTSSE